MEKKNKLIIKSFKFFFLSGIGWLIDFVVFTFLIKFAYFPIFTANCVSSFIAVTLVFFISTKSIFEKRISKLSLRSKYIIYICYQILLIFSVSLATIPVNQFLSKEFINFEILLDNSELLTKILITPVTMILNFITMKLLIEKI